MAMLQPFERISAKDVAFVPARLALGSTMIYHGATKLKPEAQEQGKQMFGQLGIKPPGFWLKATGISEVFAGVSALLGVGTRIAALAVLVTQSVAVLKVHKPKGFDITKGGFEYNLALMAIALGLLAAGPGQLSTHELAERRFQRRAAFWLPRSRTRRLGRFVRMLK